ncbi:hypothetical protein [Rhodoferax sp. OV413]|uniref:hypothetical protein n=1 Tax=Rhodoferax sp. OV413 TaxID=1855285 RepID=UPI00115FB1F6|nr:hypothetical protein [Rhodoferax sp. OV413]
MSDDFDDLFDAPASTVTAAPTPAAASAPAPAPVPATLPVPAPAAETPVRCIWMAIYKRGATVQYKGNNHTVTHVQISKGNLFVGMQDIDGVIPHEKVSVPLTEFRLQLRN